MTVSEENRVNAPLSFLELVDSFNIGEDAEGEEAPLVPGGEEGSRIVAFLHGDGHAEVQEYAGVSILE